MKILENDHLLVQVKGKGAELCSILDKKTHTEHLWQANSDIWGRHAPVLFPIVGQIEDNTYEVNNQTFKLSQHGFARDKDFELKEEFNNSLIFELESSGETLTLFPFDFKLFIVYTLNENTLEVKYRVQNTDTKDIYFSIGAHPGFTCPFTKDESFDDYYLEFEKEETLDRLLFSGGLLTGEKQKEFLNQESKIPLTRKLFEQDALIFEKPISNTISIKSKNHDKALTVGFEGFPYLGIWSKPGAEGDFVCIEPWHGITDTREANLPFEEKKGRLSLAASEKFECKFTITIG